MKANSKGSDSTEQITLSEERRTHNLWTYALFFVVMFVHLFKLESQAFLWIMHAYTFNLVLDQW